MKLHRRRFSAASLAAAIHLGVSALMAVAVAGLVFGVWYPDGLHGLTGGLALFLILMGVDVVCGPVLTLILYSPDKPPTKWRLDLGLVVLVQLGALAYGMTQVASARPVFVAFEGDRFRVVQAFDVLSTQLQLGPAHLQRLPITGPQPLGVRLAQAGDADYLSSIQQSMQGLHPAFRPSRWVPYDDQRIIVTTALRPMSVLRDKHPDRADEIDGVLRRSGLEAEKVGYLPLVRDAVTDWVVIVRRSDSEPVAYLHLDGWP